MKLLIIRLSSLGDIALISGVFEAIKRTYPEASLYFLVKKQYAELAPSLVDKVVIYEGFWKTLKKLEGERFDVVLDLHAVFRTRLLSAFVPAALKHTYNKGVWGRYRMLWKRSDTVTQCHSDNQHVVERYGEALKVLGIGCERVVVFQTAFLGDAVLTLPLLKDIRERLSPKELCILTRPQHKDIFERESYKTILDDKRGLDSGWGGFWRVRKRLAEGRFDLAIIPHRSLRSALLARLSGIVVRVGFSSSAGRCLFTRVVPFQWSDHDSSRNLRLLEFLPESSLGPSNGDFRISLSNDDKVAAKGLWRRFHVDPEKEFLIGMAPGSRWETKCWPLERFNQLAQMLRNKYPSSRIIVFGSKEDDKLCRHLDGVNLAGQVNLKELMVLISDLKLFVSNDSGPMHIACGFGLPTVAIFGPTIQGFGFYPKGRLSRVVEVEDLRCRPCSLHGGRTCPRGHFLCMRLMTPEKVLQACEEVCENSLSS